MWLVGHIALATVVRLGLAVRVVWHFHAPTAPIPLILVRLSFLIAFLASLQIDVAVSYQILVWGLLRFLNGLPLIRVGTLSIGLSSLLGIALLKALDFLDVDCLVGTHAASLVES